MTISTVYAPDTYSGDGVVDTFAITFSFLSTGSNVKVSTKLVSTGVITAKTSGVEYNVTGSNVVFTVGNIPITGETIILELNPDFTQDSDYTENSKLPAETLETDFDERCLEAQINKDLTVRSIKFDSAVTISGTLGTLPDPSAGSDKYLKLNSAGDGWELITLSTTAGLGNIIEDTTPQLGGELDANGFSVVFDTATGIKDDSGNEQLIFNKTASAVNHLEATNAATAGAPKIAVVGDDANIGLDIETKGSGDFTINPGTTGDVVVEGASIKLGDTEGILDDSSNEQLIFNKTASAVNHLETTNAATAGAPKIAAVGDDTNIGLDIESKGSGDIKLNPGTTGNIDVEGASLKFEDGKGILDDSGNETILFQKNASAVNYFNIFNASSGFRPQFAVAGSNANIGFTFTIKGSESYVFSGSSTRSAGLKLLENTSNGGNYMELRAPNDITTSTVLTLPDGDGAADSLLSTNGSGALSWSPQTSNPCKAWWIYNQPGPSITESFNLSGITDHSAGYYTVNFTTNFATDAYVTTGVVTAAGYDLIPITRAAGSQQMYTYDAAAGLADTISHGTSFGVQ